MINTINNDSIYRIKRRYNYTPIGLEHYYEKNNEDLECKVFLTRITEIFNGKYKFETEFGIDEMETVDSKNNIFYVSLNIN